MTQNATILARIAAALTDDQIVVNLNRLNRQLDEYAAEKFDTEDPALRQERAMVAALRAEYRTRTGEII